MKKLEHGDTLTVWKLDRLGRSLRDRGVKFRSLREAIDTDTPTGRAMWQMTGVLAELERSLINERTRAGVKAVRTKGVKFGRKPKLRPRQINHARKLIHSGECREDVAAPLNVARTTLYRAFPVDGPEGWPEGEDEMEYILNQLGRFVWWVQHVGGNDPIINYTFWLAVVSAFQAAIFLAQSFILFFTLRATNKSADAAKKSADALMLGDRAWVLIETDSMKDKIQAPYLPTDEQLMVEQRMPHCIVFFKNCGKTPAKITAGRFELEISDNPNVPPHSRAYDSPEGFNPFMLAQDGSAPFEARMNSAQKVTQECASVKEGLRFLWLCGIIKYVDVFERGADSQHETRFCYVWETRMNTATPFWCMKGDTNYNRFT